jgi:DNA helicase IV
MPRDAILQANFLSAALCGRVRLFPTPVTLCSSDTNDLFAHFVRNHPEILRTRQSFSDGPIIRRKRDCQNLRITRARFKRGRVILDAISISMADTRPNEIPIERIASDFAWQELAPSDFKILKILIRIEERERRHEQVRLDAKAKALDAIRRMLEREYLSADSLFELESQGSVSADEYRTEKVYFVKSWIAAQSITFNGKAFVPDDDQALAIGAVDGHIQVVARAGSGKTSVAVARAIFLQKHCGVSPNEMLLLAFNRKAADEMRSRLKENLGEIIPHVMTFHALAYAIVHPEETIVYDDPDQLGNQSQSRVVQDVIDEFLRGPEGLPAVQDLMMAHFREDWDRIIDGDYERSPEDFIAHKRSLPREGLDGHYYRSRGEKVIADFLFQYDVKYTYEYNFWWYGTNYHPDFTLFTSSGSGCIIEYFGRQGDPDYDERSRDKRKYWQDRPRQWHFFELTPSAIADDSWKIALLQLFTETGVKTQLLDDKEIWYRVKDRAIDRFTRTVKGFISHTQKLCLTPDELNFKIINHETLNLVEQDFLQLVARFYRSYLERLEATSKIDFDGLMLHAWKKVTEGETAFLRRSRDGDLRRIRFLFIDEYQDFSSQFHRLVEAIRQHNSSMSAFCIGDDWQAINGFAGSGLSYFRDFARHFDPSRPLIRLATNYRSTANVVEAGNAVMVGNGAPGTARPNAEQGIAQMADLDTFLPTPFEQEDHPGDVATPAVIRIVANSTKSGRRVVLLSRTNSMPWYVPYTDEKGQEVDRATVMKWGIGKDEDDDTSQELMAFLKLVRSRLPRDQQELVTISTTHRYKGKEGQIVIVLDALERRYPLIHPDWLFTRVLGNSLDEIVEEHRRLFYVATTRAIERLTYLSEAGRESPFLPDVPRVLWSNYPYVSQGLSDPGNSRLTVRVGNQGRRGPAPTIKIRELLSAEKFRWSGTDPGKVATKWNHWWKTFPAQNFSAEGLFDSSIWLLEADGVEVRIYDDTEKCIATYHVDDGKWYLAQGSLLERRP